MKKSLVLGLLLTLGLVATGCSTFRKGCCDKNKSETSCCKKKCDNRDCNGKDCDKSEKCGDCKGGECDIKDEPVAAPTVEAAKPTAPVKATKKATKK